MNYNDYKKARDLSWLVLMEMKIKELPVVVSRICKAYGIRLLSYESGIDIIRLLKHEKTRIISDGFTACHNSQIFIFYNGNATPERNRFTVAHELGHIFLGHIKRRDGEFTTINREPSSNDNPLEQQANVFASRLLAPACVLHELNITMPNDISKLCHISLTAAKYRSERIQLLNEREKDFKKSRGRSNYGLSPLERHVSEQFKDYIDKNRL